ncbi:MAG: hypothetical protein ACREMV_12220 [Gemmatimonadales bacterium]
MDDALKVLLKVLVLLIALVGAGSLGYLLIGSVHLFLRSRERKTGLPPETEAEWGEVKGRLAELDQLHGRLAELEERVDFAERMLAQQRDAQRVGPGQ